MVLAAALAFLVRQGSGARTPSVLLVSIDTLRADHLGTYGYRGGTSPNLDRLASRAVVFDAAFSPAPLTLPAHAALLTGRLPFRTGVRVNGPGRIGDGVPLLAEAFQRAGFATAAFIGSLVLRSDHGLARGFDLFDESFAANESRPPGEWRAERRGDEVVDRAIRWLEGPAADRRFFLWLHLYDPHAPYDPPSPYRDRFASQPYDGEVAAADAALGRLLDLLDRTGRAGSTAVAVVGDHGESLGEHGEATHGLFLYDATLRVPFLLAPPGRGPGVRVGAPVSLVDLSPTLREAAALPADPLSDGVSLWSAGARPPAPGRVVFAEGVYAAALLGWSPLRAARSETGKLIDAPRREFYDLARDPSESANRFDPEGPQTRELARHLAALASRQAAGEAPDASPATKGPGRVRELASLGYVTIAGVEGGRLDRIDGTLVDPKDRTRSWDRIERAVIAGQLDRHEEAAALLDSLETEVREGDPAVARERARALRRSGQAPRAAAAYEAVLARFNPIAEDWYGLGICRHRQRRGVEAMKALENAVRLDPSLVDAWIDLGQDALAAGGLEKGEAAFRSALRLEPRNVDALSGFAAVAFERGDLDRAATVLGEARRIEPGRRETAENLERVERAIARRAGGKR